jgi:hypothetical protein
MPGAPTVQDHLQALGETPAWVVSLGEAIQQVTDCPTAIAAARARDLSKTPKVGMGLAQVTRGWMDLEASEASGLSPMQRETLGLVLEGLMQRIKARFG